MDINLVSAAAAALAPATGASAVPAAGAATAAMPPSDAAVQDFKSMLQPDNPASGEAGALQGAPAEQGAQATQQPDAIEPVTFGDAILHKLEQLRGGINDNWQALMQAGQDGHPLSSVEMVQFQLKAVQTSFQFEFAGKVVAKSEQNIETLVKMQ